MNATEKPTRRKCAVPPGLLRRDDAAAYCGVSPATWDRWTAAGTNPAPRKIAGAVLWSRHELAEWCRRGCPERAEWRHLWKAILDR